MDQPDLIGETSDSTSWIRDHEGNSVSLSNKQSYLQDNQTVRKDYHSIFRGSDSNWVSWPDEAATQLILCSPECLANGMRSSRIRGM
jgi:hypothetical protein